ncbi:MAG TPA: tRNA (adenosine(37)-N6)-threonylcarbamoyltransferase complex ATPase subunit type 1 TsaE [Chloroflexota bacterium]|nr:tRNA (adenosine(37)-N6)-threonylcarbamoyltransferase complex ATPase subunit type 1 TsaE [Chloroflexota bacterium]
MATEPVSRHVGFVSRTPAQTKAFGAQLGRVLQPGDLILLQGPFGAGKTTLVQGLGAGLKTGGRVTSPSFTLINEYQGRLKLYHVDLFRLESLDMELEQAIEDCESGEGVTVIEWPDLLPHDLKHGALRIDLEVMGDEERGLLIHAEGTRWGVGELTEMLRAALQESEAVADE